MLGTPLTGQFRTFIPAVLAFFVATLMPGQPLVSTTTIAPRPYLLPRTPGGAALHIAMVHDILLDRYLRHGDAWYQARNAQSREILAAPPPAATEPLDERYFSAMDDLAVGLESLHQSAEAAAIMRRKLAMLPPLRLPPIKATHEPWDDREELERELLAANLPPLSHHHYTARANLGTSLIHGSFKQALAGDPAARAQLQEGLTFIQQSIALNPAAHFGREKWQAIAVQHLLASIDHPDILARFDLIGNDLTRLDPRSHHHPGYGDHLPRPAALLDSTVSLDERLAYRNYGDRPGFDPEWVDLVQPAWTTPVPFDEPALALIGMWMLGGGPNPFSAITLANLAFTEHQYEIAWDGYERAQELQSALPGEGVRKALTDFCTAQENKIAQIESPASPEAWQTRTRARHQSELAWAHQYQTDYQDFEARQLAAGIPLDAPHFYDSFFAEHPPIASPTQSADYLTVTTTGGFLNRTPSALAAAGIVAFLFALTTPRR